MRRLAFVAFVMLGGTFIAVGGAYALRGTPVAYRIEAPEPSPSLADLQGACVASGGAFWTGMESGIVVARCRPFIDVGVHPVKRGSK